MGNYNIKCDTCGRFISQQDLKQGGGGSSLFVPSSDVSYEELSYRCKNCTIKHSKPLAMQNVVQDKVSHIH